MHSVLYIKFWNCVENIDAGGLEVALSISSNASLMFESWCVADFAKMISLGIVSTIVMFVLALQQECCNTASVWVKKSPSEGKVGTYNQTISIQSNLELSADLKVTLNNFDQSLIRKNSNRFPLFDRKYSKRYRQTMRRSIWRLAESRVGWYAWKMANPTIQRKHVKRTTWN